MNILPQILKISSINLLVNHLVDEFKKKIDQFLEHFIYGNDTHPYSSFFLEMQTMMNRLCLNFISKYYELIDMDFRNSKERMKNYVINKSNVPRTLITIFGTFTFYRTLYQHKITGEYYFYVDDVCGIDAYKNYDPLVRSLLVQDSVLTNPSHTSNFSSLSSLNLLGMLKGQLSIPKQTIYKMKQEIKIRKIAYEEIEIPNHALYVMVDEKWIHEQDKTKPNQKKWIMGKCFVLFTGIKRKGKRSRLVGKHIFMTTSNEPWKELMNEVDKIYNFEEINTINLLSDAGSWILSGAYELKLYSNNKLIINTCEFHVKQKINRSTSDKELRQKIADIIYKNEDKKAFIKEMDKLIESKEKESRKQKITEYKNYILKHWKGIINMKNSLCKSSMEAHIEHCIASAFSSVPKSYSRKNIETYIKLQEMFLNGISIFEYYLDTYNSNENYEFNNKKEVNYSLFESSTSNMPILNSSSNVSHALHDLIY